MQALSPNDILDIWERAHRQHPLERALTILAAGSPGSGPEDLAGLSIGERDIRLAALREAAFGNELACFVQCPRCGERLEFHSNIAELFPPQNGRQAGGEFDFEAGGRTMRVRMPTSRDLAFLVKNNIGGVSQARRELARRCVVGGSDADDGFPSQLTDAAIDLLSNLMAARDPGAETLLDFKCPGCGHDWQSIFDIAEFFWRELSAQARRLLREVHELAAAYGWSEHEILSLSPQRRRLYLEMVNE